jgi:hypothetical protein
MLFAKLVDPRRSAFLFICVLVIMYGIVPFVLGMFFYANPYFIELTQICSVSCLGIAIGFSLPLLDHRFKHQARRIIIDGKTFHIIVWLSFIAFMAVTFSTAKSIPIISAFSGAAADELSQQRGDFLKARIGIELILLYMSTIFVNTLLPYSLVNLFIEKSRYRFVLMGTFLAFAISFLQKTLFLTLMLPLLYIALKELKVSLKKVLYIFICSMALLYLITILAFGGGFEFDKRAADDGVLNYFSPSYICGGIMEYIVWRSIAVPIFTASDALLVFNEQFSGQPLLGATSSFISTIFSMERINIERYIFEHQFGSWNDIANANSVFICDAYVNFGWVGVLLFSIFVGQSLRWFWKSKDVAFKSLWILYCFSLYSGPLIGMILSNGYFYMFFHALFLKIKNKSHIKDTRIGNRKGV